MTYLTQVQYDNLKLDVSFIERDSSNYGLPLDLTNIKAAIEAAKPFIPVLVRRPINLADLTCDVPQYESSRYQRYQRKFVFNTSAINLQFHRVNIANGGTVLPFNYPRYELEINGVSRASYTTVLNAHAGYLVGTFVDEPDGIIKTEIIGVNADGSRVNLMTHMGYLNRNGKASDAGLVIIDNASRDWVISGEAGLPVEYQYSIIPISVMQTTRVKPLVPRLGKVFNTAVTLDKLTKVNIIPLTASVPHKYVSKTKEGVFVAEGRESYFKPDLLNNVSWLPLKAGQRGIGSGCMPLALRAGRGGKTYACDNFSFYVVDNLGTKRVLAGRVHKDIPFWDDVDQTWDLYDTVGDWDASIPVKERFAWEPWSIAVRKSTLTVNRDVPLVTDALTPAPGLPPHYAGPIFYLPDKHGYVLEVKFDPVDHMVPAKIRRLCAVNDPWSVDELDGVIYVAERGLDRISMWNADTGAYIGNWAGTTNLGLGKPGSTRVWAPYPGVTLAAIRAYNEPVGVEHARIIPIGGVKYMYWSSLATQQVRRQKLDKSGPIEIVCLPQIDNNSGFIVFDVSLGTFGPEGTVFTTTWSVTNLGRPQAFLPIAGLAADGTALTNRVIWKWNDLSGAVHQGIGGKYQSAGYGSAVCVGRKGDGSAEDPDYGVLLCGSSSDCIEAFMLADPAYDNMTPFDYTKANVGLGEFTTKHRLILGTGCDGFDVPIPKAEMSDNELYYVERVCGY